MKILYFYLSGLLLLWSSCQRPTMLDFALRYAGENRVELEKVLDHYRNDSLKYRAAVFLIGNMPYHYFYTGAQLDSLRQGYRWMQRTGLSAKAVKHKLWKTFGEPDVRRWMKRNDAHHCSMTRPSRRRSSRPTTSPHRRSTFLSKKTSRTPGISPLSTQPVSRLKRSEPSATTR